MATESTSWGTFKGLFAFFILLPIGSCVACSMCVAVAGSGSTPSTTQASPPPVDSALFVVPVGGQCRIPDDCVVGAECLSDLRTDAAARSGIKLCFNMSDADPKPKHPKHLRVSGHPYPDGHGGYQGPTSAVRRTSEHPEELAGARKSKTEAWLECTTGAECPGDELCVNHQCTVFQRTRTGGAVKPKLAPVKAKAE